MQMISVIDGALCWARKKGGFYMQLPLYHRGTTVFMKVGAYYVRLRDNGTTSHPDIRWEEIEPGELGDIQIAARKDPVFSLAPTTPTKRIAA